MLHLSFPSLESLTSIRERFKQCLSDNAELAKNTTISWEVGPKVGPKAGVRRTSGEGP